ncbi:MAG: hypothetical protein HXX08_10720 [Chloroflexi bacterium]|uniref:Uncharacterized protein n=1 Tax=Candidatus Chlorohelix allophototropha TaxID=3003348 RepID=A0A8T7M211_9CHLR|nr:hypothetical protein [Chloroflexota bacterium]WJW65710.1 hypothetical protein OZ401_001488 [Chloroflexota bacterium L227-S17]
MAMPLRDLQELDERYGTTQEAAKAGNKAPVKRERSGTTRSRTRANTVSTQTEVEEARVKHEKEELIAALEMKRDELIERLDRGAAAIEEARAAGRNPRQIADWEDYWIQLLRNYEKICDQLVELGIN